MIRWNLPSAKRERLMLFPSRKRSPDSPVAHPLSDPAKSMSDIFATLTFVLRPDARSLCLIQTWNKQSVQFCNWGYVEIRKVTWKTAWEREDSALWSVGCCVRLLFPYLKRESKASAPDGFTDDNPVTVMPSWPLSRIVKKFDCANKSRTFSLYT